MPRGHSGGHRHGHSRNIGRHRNKKHHGSGLEDHAQGHHHNHTTNGAPWHNLTCPKRHYESLGEKPMPMILGVIYGIIFILSIVTCSAYTNVNSVAWVTKKYYKNYYSDDRVLIASAKVGLAGVVDYAGDFDEISNPDNIVKKYSDIYESYGCADILDGNENYDECDQISTCIDTGRATYGLTIFIVIVCLLIFSMHQFGSGTLRLVVIYAGLPIIFITNIISTTIFNGCTTGKTGYVDAYSSPSSYSRDFANSKYCVPSI
jgi:hypothetical protein